MWSTPAPPSTALVAASIWSGTGDVNTSPAQAASSMPRPTKPPCIGSWPEPPPEMIPTFPWRGASARTTTFGSMTRTRSPCAAAIPARASLTTFSGALMSFFIDMSLLAPPSVPRPMRARRDDPRRGRRIDGSGHEVVREQGLVGHGTKDAADDRSDHRNPAVAPVRCPLAGDRQHGVRDAGPEVAGRIDRVARRSAEREADGPHEEADQERPRGRWRARCS